MKAVIGLGNPGMKYDRTKHNVGFMLLDIILKDLNLSYRNDFRGKFTEGRLGENKILFLKPYTYMNLSGYAVAELVDYYKLLPEDVIVLHDDMDLPLGRIRLRAKGSSGGHNGLKSIITELGTQEFWRLKIGVGRPEQEEDVVGHVLSSFNKEEAKIVQDVMDRARKAILLWLENNQDEAMNIYNQDK